MTEIQSAVPQLLDLAEAMRGREWRDQLDHALGGAIREWGWLRAYREATALIGDPKGHPRDLTAAVADPLRHGRRPAPGAEQRGAALARDLIAAQRRARRPAC